MEPFVNEFKLLPNSNKKLVLFGSYGWDNGAFMQEWSNRMESYDFNVIGELAVKESPDQEQLDLAKELGKKLAE
jgi:flavorubredoxin